MMRPLSWVCAMVLIGACTPTHESDDGGADEGSPIEGEAPEGHDIDGELSEGQSNEGAGNACIFNSDCVNDRRCECAAGECACTVGVRGTGASGIDLCVDGNDCASSLCVEGTIDDYCSGPCKSSDDCGPQLPMCADIAFIGRICVRA